MERSNSLGGIFIIIGKVIAAIAIAITTFNINTCCMFVMHQPKLPDGADKLRKF